MCHNDDVETLDRTRPEVRGDDVLADIEPRFFLLPERWIPPASISISVPVGKPASRLSPCPTSIALNSNLPRSTTAGNGWTTITAKAAAPTIQAICTRGFEFHPPGGNDQSGREDRGDQKGGAGMRQSGSHRAWTLTAIRAIESSHAHSWARAAELNAIAAKPMGTIALKTGTTIAFADNPETDIRWK